MADDEMNEEEFHGDGISVGAKEHESDLCRNLHQTEAPKKIERVSAISEA